MTAWRTSSSRTTANHTVYACIGIGSMLLLSACVGANADVQDTENAFDGLQGLGSESIQCENNTDAGALWGRGIAMRACLTESASTSAMCLERFFARHLRAVDTQTSQNWGFCNNGDRDDALLLRLNTLSTSATLARSCANWPSARSHPSLRQFVVARKLNEHVESVLHVQSAAFQRYEGVVQKNCTVLYNARTQVCENLLCADDPDGQFWTEGDREYTRIATAILIAGGFTETEAGDLATALVARLHAGALQLALLTSAFHRVSE